MRTATIIGFRRALTALLKPSPVTNDPNHDAHQENVRAADLRQLARRVKSIAWNNASAEAARIHAAALAEAERIDAATSHRTATVGA